MKCASIYQRPEGFIIHADAPLSERGWIASAPVLRVPSTASVEELAQALLEVLEQEQTQVEWPTDWKETGKQYLRLLGIKSIRAFYTNCNYCSVEFNVGVLSFEPSKNEKTGFTFFANSTLTVDSDNLSVVGETLLKALAMCK